MYIRWSQIAQHLPGRTDNEVKNLWHSYLKKKLDKQQQKQAYHSSTNSTTSDSADSSTTNPSIHSPIPNNNISQLPKLFFAEWLTVGSSSNGGSEFGPSTTNNLIGQPNFEFGMSLGSELLQNNGIIMDSHVKFEDHHISNGFANYASDGDVCVEHLLHFGNGFMNI